ncbi:unnamed protein product, partial [Iphiclides podalirius]
MIVIVLYFAILNICLQDVLQEELMNYSSEKNKQNKTTANENGEGFKSYEEDSYGLPKVDWFNFTTNGNKDMDSPPVPSNNEGMKRNGASQLNMLKRFLGLKSGFDEGVNGASRIFGGVRKSGSGS